MVQRWLLDRAVILARTTTRDSTGGTVTTWPEPGRTDVPCRWGAPTDEEAVAVGGAVSGKAPLALSLAVGDPIREGDRVRNPALPNVTYSVVANRTAASVMATQTRVIVREV